MLSSLLRPPFYFIFYPSLLNETSLPRVVINADFERGLGSVIGQLARVSMVSKKQSADQNQINQNKQKMSDVLTKYQSLCIIKELKDIEITESEFHYAYKRSCDAVLGLKIPFAVLKCWHGLVRDGSAVGDVSFVELLEYSIPGNSFVFIDDVEAREEIDDHVSKLAGNVVTLYRKTKGRARKELDERYKIFHIKKGYVKSVAEWMEEIDKLENTVEEWRKNYKNLEQSKIDLYNSLVKELEKKDQQIEELENVNKELSRYITDLEGSAYKGKPLSESKNKNRTLKCFLNKAQRALWFSKYFGIEIKSLIVKDTTSGHQRRIELNTSKSSEKNADSYNNADNTSTDDGDADRDTDGNGDDKGFESLSQAEKDRVEKVLFLLDKFCVGDMFYHEFSYICDGLPKSYLIKQCRSKHNDMCHITSLPGSFNGCQVSSVVDLLKENIVDYLTHNDFAQKQDKLKIKINGDGARMTRNTSYIILSFSILQTGQDVMSSKGNRTIAVVDSILMKIILNSKLLFNLFLMN